MRNFQGYFSRTFQVLEFSRKNPGLSRRRGNPVKLITHAQTKSEDKAWFMEHLARKQFRRMEVEYSTGQLPGPAGRHRSLNTQQIPARRQSTSAIQALNLAIPCGCREH